MKAKSCCCFCKQSQILNAFSFLFVIFIFSSSEIPVYVLLIFSLEYLILFSISVQVFPFLKQKHQSGSAVNIWTTFYSLFKIFKNLFERQCYRGGEKREGLPSVYSPRWLQWPELEQSKAGSEEHFLVSTLVQGPKALGYFHCFPRHIWRELDPKGSSRDSDQCPFGLPVSQIAALSTVPQLQSPLLTLNFISWFFLCESLLF